MLIIWSLHASWMYYVLKKNQSLILISSNNSYVARFTTTKKLVGSLSILEIVSPISEYGVLEKLIDPYHNIHDQV